MGLFHPVRGCFIFSPNQFFGERSFGAPKPLLILTSSQVVKKKGFPVVKALSSQIEDPQKKRGAPVP